MSRPSVSRPSIGRPSRARASASASARGVALSLLLLVHQSVDGTSTTWASRDSRDFCSARPLQRTVCTPVIVVVLVVVSLLHHPSRHLPLASASCLLVAACRLHEIAILLRLLARPALPTLNPRNSEGSPQKPRSPSSRQSSLPVALPLWVGTALIASDLLAPRRAAS